MPPTRLPRPPRLSLITHSGSSSPVRGDRFWRSPVRLRRGGGVGAGSSVRVRAMAAHPRRRPSNRAAKTARSAQPMRGRGLARRGMATAWRSTSNAMSLESCAPINTTRLSRWQKLRCAAARPAPAAPSGRGRRHVATVLALTLHARQACFRRPLRGGPRNGRGSGEARRVRAFRVTAVSAETLRTLRDVVIFVDKSAELVVSSDVVDRGSGAAGKWP